MEAIDLINLWKQLLYLIVEAIDLISYREAIDLINHVEAIDLIDLIDLINRGSNWFN